MTMKVYSKDLNPNNSLFKWFLPKINTIKFLGDKINSRYQNIIERLYDRPITA